jgi:hypothetical protein
MLVGRAGRVAATFAFRARRTLLGIADVIWKKGSPDSYGNTDQSRFAAPVSLQHTDFITYALPGAK